MRPCIDCGTPTPGTRCPTHQAPVDQRTNRQRHAKQKAHGRTTARWQRIRREVITRDQGRCQAVLDGTRCGRPANSVHLNPALNGRHDLATAADCVLLCARCHGQTDGRRSRG